MNKYKIEEVRDIDLWYEFVKNSPQYTIFTHPTYLKSFGGKFRLLFVYKGNQIKAGVCLLLSDDEKSVILDDLIIYAGILFGSDPYQKLVKARNEQFEITEFVIKELDSTYNRIEMALSPFFEDLRPFLWYNYHSDRPKDKFVLDLRYTSYLDISELCNGKNEYETKLYKNFETLRQRNIKDGRKKGGKTLILPKIDFFLKFYYQLMASQGERISENKLNNMKAIIKALISNDQAQMFVTFNEKGDIIYITVFCYDHYRAYYLFGAGNPEARERYKGTLCFWDAFNILAKKYGIKEVDLEGVNSPYRGWFKLSFGGRIVPYYHIFLR
jgi:hypothetical protein